MPSEAGFGIADAPTWLSVIREAGAESCPGTEVLESMVRERLTSVSDPAESGLRVDVELRANGAAGLRARVEISDDDTSVGRRELTSARSDCDELGHAVAITVALAVDMRLLARVAPSEPEADAASPEEDEDLVEELPLPKPPRKRVRRKYASRKGVHRTEQPRPRGWDPENPWPLQGAVRAGSELALGLMPKPALGLTLGGSLRPSRRLSVELSLSLFPFEVSTPLQDGEGDVGYSAGLGEAALCMPLAESRETGLFACAGLSLGWLHYSPPPSLKSSEAATQSVANALLSAVVRQTLGRSWGAVLKAGPALPLEPLRFTYVDARGWSNQLYEMSGVIGMIELAFEYRDSFSKPATHKPEQYEP